MLTVYTDGGSRGNPGLAGYGVVVEDGRGALLAELSAAIGRPATCNEAEYEALLAALAYALNSGEYHVRVCADSKLLVEQMRGRWKVKAPTLRPLYERAKALQGRLERVTFEWIPRAQNGRADALANEAMDAA